jgi:hypothetical protein
MHVPVEGKARRFARPRFGLVYVDVSYRNFKLQPLLLVLVRHRPRGTLECSAVALEFNHRIRTLSAARHLNIYGVLRTKHRKLSTAAYEELQ